MGGITFLFSGDFRQTLPVINRGTRADEVNASLKRSYLWNDVKKLSLTINMRVRQEGDPSALQFSNLLLDIGEGNITDENGEVSLSKELCEVVHSIEDLIEKVYPDIKDIKNKEDSWLSERAILCPKNEMVAHINNIIIDKFEANDMVYTSINTMVNQDDATNYTVEFLNSVSVPGRPSHTIKLKIEMCIRDRLYIL